MPHNKTNNGFDKVAYSATNPSVRLSSRKFKRYPATHSTAKDSSSASFSRFGARLDGQSLAGTGALVFEGELLVTPRT